MEKGDDKGRALMTLPFDVRPNETVEKPAFERLMENGQMQGFRDPEERGVH